MLKYFSQILLLCLIFSDRVLAQKKYEIKFSEEEINYIHDSKEDIVYISNDIKSTIKKLEKKGIIQNAEHDLKQLIEACSKDWKVVPARVAEQAIEQLNKELESNKNKFETQDKYDTTKKKVENYKQKLETKEAQFFFGTRQLVSNDQVIDKGVFNTLIVNDILRAKNILRVNFPNGDLAFKVEPTQPLSVCNVPLRVEFQQSGTNALTVIGKTELNNLLVNGNATISGNLNANSIKENGSAVIVSAANVGSGTGLIFKNKSGDTLNFRSLVAGTNVTFDTSDPNQITISAVGSGMGDVTGPSSSTDNAISRFDGTTGKIIQNSSVTIDDSGNVVTGGQMTASQFNGPLNGNATTATTATNFSGSLSGDVTGTQSATVVSTVGGVSAANVASGATAANNATSSNTASTIVKRDASGNFSAGTITADLNGNASTATTATTATNFSGSLSGDVTGTQSATVVSTINGQSAANTVVNTGTSTDNAISRFDGTTGKIIQNSAVTIDDSGNVVTSGQMTASQFNGSLNGNATTATTATNFSGSLSGDVTGTQSATVVSNVPSSATINGQSAANTVVNTGTSTDNAIARFDGTTGKIIQNSTVTVDDSGNIATAGNLNLTTSPSTATAGMIQQGGTRFIHNRGTLNFFAGIASGSTATTSTGNTGVGFNSLFQVTSGGSNTAVGVSTLGSITTGTGNTGIGSSALASINTETANTAVGSSALAATSSGSNNVAVGSTALGSALTAGSSNIAIGAFALNSNGNTASDNVAVGHQALERNTTGTPNVGVGYQALQMNTAGTNNVAVGYQTLTNSVLTTFTASENTVIGSGALTNVTTGGDSNTVVGRSAMGLTSSPGSQNVAIGQHALENNTEDKNTAVGYQALRSNTTGSSNTAVGGDALVFLTTGSDNTSVGIAALESLTTEVANTAVGSTAGQNLVGNNNTLLGYSACIGCTGDRNTAIGSAALGNISTGNDNIALGYQAGNNLSVGNSNNIHIGNPGTNTDNNTIKIGTAGTHATCFIAGISGVTTGGAAVNVLIDNNGQLGTASSSKRFKKDIEDLPDTSAAISNLRPVTFKYKEDNSNTTQYGLIAEEVEAIFPELVIKNKEGQVETVKYQFLPILLLSELQKLRQKVNQLETQLANK